MTNDYERIDSHMEPAPPDDSRGGEGTARKLFDERDEERMAQRVDEARAFLVLLVAVSFGASFWEGPWFVCYAAGVGLFCYLSAIPLKEKRLPTNVSEIASWRQFFFSRKAVLLFMYVAVWTHIFRAFHSLYVFNIADRDSPNEKHEQSMVRLQSTKHPVASVSVPTKESVAVANHTSATAIRKDPTSEETSEAQKRKDLLSRDWKKAQEGVSGQVQLSGDGQTVLTVDSQGPSEIDSESGVKLNPAKTSVPNKDPSLVELLMPDGDIPKKEDFSPPQKTSKVDFAKSEVNLPSEKLRYVESSLTGNKEKDSESSAEQEPVKDVAQNKDLSEAEVLTPDSKIHEKEIASLSQNMKKAAATEYDVELQSEKQSNFEASISGEQGQDRRTSSPSNNGDFTGQQSRETVPEAGTVGRNPESVPQPADSVSSRLNLTEEKSSTLSSSVTASKNSEQKTAVDSMSTGKGIVLTEKESGQARSEQSNKGAFSQRRQSLRWVKSSLMAPWRLIRRKSGRDSSRARTFQPLSSECVRSDGTGTEMKEFSAAKRRDRHLDQMMMDALLEAWNNHGLN